MGQVDIMNTFFVRRMQLRPGGTQRRHEWARVQPVLWVGVCGLVLLASGGWWFSNWMSAPDPPAPALAPSNSDASLSPGSLDVLSRLDSALQIRYYAILDSGAIDDGLRRFATEVGQRLSAYQESGQGRVEVVRHESRNPVSVSGAAEDGLTPFHLDKGEPCYFGLVVVLRGKKEVLPRLNPQWSQAFEPDLTRAIERLIRDAQPARAAFATTADPDAATIASVKRLVPEFATLSLEEGTRILREASLRQLESAVQSTDAQIKEIERRLVEAQRSQSQDEQQLAIQELQRVQGAQAAKLQEISARSLAEIEALRSLKATGR